MITAKKLRDKIENNLALEKKMIEELPIMPLIEKSIISASDDCKYSVKVNINSLVIIIQEGGMLDLLDKIYIDQIHKLELLGYTVNPTSDGIDLLISWCEK